MTLIGRWFGTGSPGLGRMPRWRTLLVALAAASLLAGAPAHSVLASTEKPGTSPFVVTGGSVAAVADAVRAAGGIVVDELALVDGVAARLPVGAVLPTDFQVTPDRAVSFDSHGVDGVSPAFTLRATVGLPTDGNEGAGVTVALVDTGVADVPDLTGRVVEHIDVTGTGDGDGYGHGTFLAGLIVGKGEPDGSYRGVAPGARVLDVKVAGPDGTTSMVSVLRGLGAVAERGPRHGVKVVNLSLSSGSALPYQVDPLNQALRALWKRGFTVVVSSGNDGPSTGSVSTPGNDPVLVTVGGLDEGLTSDRAGDTVAEWSGRGPTSQGINKPELVAPGAHVVGLRSPGSVIDRSYPSARVSDRYVRGSGTSMSAAVASAAVADLLAVNPRLRPDDVKALLMGTAYQAPGLGDREAAGAGGLDVGAALAAAGSARPGQGGASADERPGDPVTWQALANAFAADDRAAALQAWKALEPQARSWAARSWATLDPQARSWAARSWAARSWAARSWAARSWAGADGTAEEWLARSWAARSWAARSWAARSWAARSWAARSWAGDDWAARSWAARSWAGIWD